MMTMVSRRPYSGNLTISIAMLAAVIVGALIIYSALVPMNIPGETFNKANYRSLLWPETIPAVPVALPFKPNLEQKEHRAKGYLTNDSVSKQQELRASDYSIQFSKPAGMQPVLVFHAVQDSAYVHLNGVMIAEIGEMTLPKNGLYPRNRHIPNIVHLPVDLLKEENTVSMEVRSTWPAALGPITLANEHEVQSSVNWYRFWRLNFLWIGIAFALPMGLFMLSVWFFHRDRVQYFWLGLVMVLWPFNTFYMTFVNIPVNTYAYGFIPLASNLFYATALTCFVLTYRGKNQHWMPLLWKVSAVLYTLAFLARLKVEWGFFGTLLNTNYIWMAVLSTISTWGIVANAFEKRTYRSILMATSGLIVEVIALWDIVPFLGIWEVEPISFTVQYGVLIVLVFYSAVMSYELALALRKSDQYAEHLKAEVEEQTHKIRSQYDDIVRLEKQQTIHNERSRLIADMHDGTNGQLASIIAGLKNKKLSTENTIEQLELCNRDLRLILDSMNAQANEDLASAFGLLRSRLTPLVEGAGLTLNWQTHSIEDGLQCSPEVLLNLFRIVQESISNVIKHANASGVFVTAKWEADLLVINIRDDGEGFDASDTQNSGYGLASMRKRAESISAVLDVQSNGHGTEIHLRLPVSKDPAVVQN